MTETENPPAEENLDDVPMDDSNGSEDGDDSEVAAGEEGEGNG
jgi:hypothetical protein